MSCFVHQSVCLGGQQRRVSLASALVHHPPLLILDEPTVGVDPVLRKAIWEHLDALCREDGLTVIITTHYIEEARTAETVGLMRFGRLLVQSNPEELLTHHGLPTLEAVFLKLCQLDSAQVPEAVKSDSMRYNESDFNLNQIEYKKDVPSVNVTVTNPDGSKQAMDDSDKTSESNMDMDMSDKVNNNVQAVKAAAAKSKFLLSKEAKPSRTQNVM